MQFRVGIKLKYALLRGMSKIYRYPGITTYTQGSTEQTAHPGVADQSLYAEQGERAYIRI